MSRNVAMHSSRYDYDNKPGHFARRFQQHATAAFQTEMEKLGMDVTPVQYAALAAIAAKPRIDQATLASAIACDRATINGVVDRLERKGLIERQICMADRRSRELTITDAGSTMLDKIEPGVEAAQALMTSGLTEREVVQLLRLLRKAVQHPDDRSHVSLRA